MKTELLDTEIPNQVVLGDRNAPLKITEYASLSCPHCRSFHQDTLPQIKKDWVDTGKAVYVFRNFPLNEPALRAAQLVSCVQENKKWKFLDVLFQTQPEWAASSAFKQKLALIAKIGGMTEEHFYDCINDKNLEDQLLGFHIKAAEELNVSTTPTVFVNHVKLKNNDLASIVAELEAGGVQPAVARE